MKSLRNNEIIESQMVIFPNVARLSALNSLERETSHEL